MKDFSELISTVLYGYQNVTLSLSSSGSMVRLVIFKITSQNHTAFGVCSKLFLGRIHSFLSVNRFSISFEVFVIDNPP